MAAERHSFQAEIKQLLHILVHSLYTEREIFLRELISNASDALSKLQIEKLSNDNILDPSAELGIWIQVNTEAKTIRIIDTGLGMTHAELIENLGTIAQSGARAFVQRMGQNQAENASATDLIGQFGVGFYSVFMVADRVEVTSRSYLPDAPAQTWISNGEESYEILPAEKSDRGTEILIHLRDEAAEFANEWKLREIIKRHSDYISFPIYLIDENAEAPQPDEESEDGEDQPQELSIPKPVNQQTAIWRQPTSEITDEDYNNFYRMLTLDFEEPIMRISGRGDAPIQYYSLLFIPAKAERNMFSPRREPGLKLYARKILIQEYSTALLPEYFQFVQGVVDSEDISLNVSRESAQSDPQMAKLKQTLTRKVINELKRLADNEPETYLKIWEEYGVYIKNGVISDYSEQERLLPLLRFHSSNQSELTTLEAYVERMEAIEGQDAIYYLAADSLAAAQRSPHLDPFRGRGIDVLILLDSIDGFLMNTLRDFRGHKFVSADVADLDLSEVGQASEEAEDEKPQVEQAALDQLIVKMRDTLSEAVESVRVSKVLTGANPVRLVTPEGALDRHTQRVYQMLDRDFEVPTRIMEINPRHPIIHNLAAQLERGLIHAEQVEQHIRLLYENALLADGIHPNPAELAAQIQALLEQATNPRD